MERRKILKAGVIGGAALLIPAQGAGRAWADDPKPVQSPTLDPAKIRKYVTPLVIPAVMPSTDARRGAVDHYLIGVRQFHQQVLPPGLPSTRLWAYGAVNQKKSFRFPACTIEANVDRPVQITWVNELVDHRGHFLPHLLPVEPALHWANPGGGIAGRDSRPTFSSAPGPYRGPVPIVTHMHGAHVSEESDGHPEAWYLPNATNIPKAFAKVGSSYDDYGGKFTAGHGVKWKPGTATFQYPNDQRATTQWYHDHALGLTRLNVYAGLSGFYLLRGGKSDLPSGVLPGPAPGPCDPPGTKYYEIPLIIQDRSFNADGSLFYPGSRGVFDSAGPTMPGGPFPPIWNPEYSGHAMVVNGNTWPVAAVEPRRYRLRLLNGCNTRFLILKIASNSLGSRPAPAALPFWQIGSDGGFLPAPVQLEQILLAPAERADVIVDFTGLRCGTELYLINEAPDGHLAAGDLRPADPGTTGQVMKFVVGKLCGKDTSVRPDQLTLPPKKTLGEATVTRRLSINQVSSGGQPVELLLGTVDNNGAPVPAPWHGPVTEHPALNATEIWEFQNFTGDAHPIHLHLVQFEVLGRGVDGNEPPQAWELGTKDTVVAPPGQITRIKAHFDLPGHYVWHCHILEHEDNSMMRPYKVG